ncbi:MAG: amidohydrolase family protein [Planctomycetota bacterium]|nr:amidohydrolase family protein [Planctomycetota bacterium]
MKVQRSLRATIAFYTVLLAVIVFFDDANPETEQAKPGTYVDIHMHFSNQLAGVGPDSGGRKPPGGKPPGKFEDEDFIACADNMIAHMDRCGLQKAVVMPQPRLAGQPGCYGYKQILAAVRKYPGRLYLGGGGGALNSMIHSTAPADVTDAVRARFKEEALAIVKEGAKAFGEFAALHLSLNPQHVFEEVIPDHPLFLLLADIAAEHDIPIDIHMEAVVKDTPPPDNLRRISTKNPTTLKANIAGLERLLQHNRKAKIVWQHMGWDNIGQMTIGLLREMLEKHPNLYLGFKIEERSCQVGTKLPMPNRIVDGEMQIRPEWIKFFTDFADRVLVGSDEFIGIEGRTVRPPQSFEETWTAVMQLPADVMSKVARDNAIKLYRLD